MQIADRWALWNVGKCVENFLLQIMLFQKVAVCRKMYSNVLLQSDTVLQQNVLSVIAAGCKEPTEETSVSRPIGAVPNTLIYCKFVCAKRIWGSCTGRGKKFFFSEKRLDLLLGTPKFLSNDTRALHPGPRADKSFPFNGTFKNVCSYTASPSFFLKSSCLIWHMNISSF